MNPCRKVGDLQAIASARSTLHANAQLHLLRESLQRLGGRLDPARFARMHALQAIGMAHDHFVGCFRYGGRARQAAEQEVSIRTGAGDEVPQMWSRSHNRTRQ